MSHLSSSYYAKGGIETIDILRAKLTTEEFEGFLKGNIIKYVHRAGHKPRNSKLSDVAKAQYYMDKWVRHLWEQPTEPEEADITDAGIKM